MKIESVTIQFRDILVENDGGSREFSAESLGCKKIHYVNEPDQHAIYVYNKRRVIDYPFWCYAEVYKYHKDIVKDVLILRELGGNKKCTK